MQGNVQQLEGRINNQILGIKGLKRKSLKCPVFCFTGKALFLFLGEMIPKLKSRQSKSSQSENTNQQQGAGATAKKKKGKKGKGK